MTEENKFKDEIDDNKNKNLIICQFCKSVMLKQHSVSYTENQFSLPKMHQKNTVSFIDLEIETIKHYWKADDMFTFENIGFSNTVHDTKYLICADCEMGPVGYFDITTKKCYVSLKRVEHVDKI